MGRRPFYLSLGLLVGTLLLVGMVARRPVPVVVRTNLEKLPLEMAGYRGSDDTFPESVYRELNADRHVYRHYLRGDGSRIDLYIGYYGTAKGGRTAHNPYACLPGAGWAIVDSRTETIHLPAPAKPVAVNYVLARRDGISTVMLHWYQTAGTTVMSTGIQQNAERFRGRALHNRNDGAYVQVSTQVPDDRVVVAGPRLQAFAGEILTLLPGYWPLEQ